ncbi:MAG TPA: BolA/IbaG family iron-sulfur metabolism protein [Gammaproteobacteria bacterium]|nr:BolA/IbaG family iron-sulfur metabolism protein [Gammaproteobacteria bacterium]
MITKEEIKQLIEAGLPAANAMIDGDDGTHFDGIVVSSEFEGKSMLAQHRMVFDTLGDRMQTGIIHALSVKTCTPDEWESRKD